MSPASERLVASMNDWGREVITCTCGACGPAPMTWKKLGRRLWRAGDVGVAGQRCSGMTSSPSESEQREGAASMSSSSATVLGDAIECVSSMLKSLRSMIVNSVEEWRSVSARFGPLKLRRGRDWGRGRGRVAGILKLTPSWLTRMGAEIGISLIGTLGVLLRRPWGEGLSSVVRRRPRTCLRNQIRRRAILTIKFYTMTSLVDSIISVNLANFLYIVSIQMLPLPMSLLYAPPPPLVLRM